MGEPLNTHVDGSVPGKLSERAFAEFKEIVADINAVGVGGQAGARRVEGRLKMRGFIEEHGREACDAAFKEIK